MMRYLQRLILHPRADKIFLYVLGSVYLVYLVAFGRFLSIPLLAPAENIIEHAVDINPAVVVQYWTMASMQGARDANVLVSKESGFTPESSDISQGKAVQQEGQPPNSGEASYPLSTVGKVFFTNEAGQNYVCSGTAVVSSNHNLVDTAGHCLYLFGSWAHNVIFCPLYENGITPYGCWAARELEVPSEWINAGPNDFHRDFGMAVVAPNSEGNLTDVVGGAGWAYNQPVDQPFYAYGYPAGYPFDGQTRQSCESSCGTLWQHGDGHVVSIPCNMTGGCSGGPWFIQIDGKWYLNGHNDFVSRLQPGHIFSPYYDDTWYALYSKGQQT